MLAERETQRLKTAADASASGKVTFDKMTLVQRIENYRCCIGL